MDVIKTGVTLLNGITKFISALMKEIYTAIKPKAEELIDKLSVKKINLNIGNLTLEVKEKMSDPIVSKVAFCDLKQLSTLHSNVPEWSELAKNGVTHMLIRFNHDDIIIDAYFYQDLSSGADKQVSELINKTGEGMVVINS